MSGRRRTFTFARTRTRSTLATRSMTPSKKPLKGTTYWLCKAGASTSAKAVFRHRRWRGLLSGMRYWPLVRGLNEHRLSRYRRADDLRTCAVHAAPDRRRVEYSVRSLRGGSSERTLQARRRQDRCAFLLAKVEMASGECSRH